MIFSDTQSRGGNDAWEISQIFSRRLEYSQQSESAQSEGIATKDLGQSGPKFGCPDKPTSTVICLM